LAQKARVLSVQHSFSAAMAYPQYSPYGVTMQAGMPMMQASMPSHGYQSAYQQAMPTTLPSAVAKPTLSADAAQTWKAGDLVKLRGQSHDPRYASIVYQVVTPDQGNGQVQVSFSAPDGRQMKSYLAAGALEPTDAPAGGATKASASSASGGGVRVKLVVAGVGAAQHLNGKMGSVLGDADARGNYKVTLDEGQLICMPAVNLQKADGSAFGPRAPAPAAATRDLQGFDSDATARAPAAAPAAQAVGVGNFKVGDEVKITGLAGLSIHDGKIATVAGAQAGDGSVHVKVDNKSFLNLQPNYLQPVATEEKADKAKTKSGKKTKSSCC